MRRRVGALVAAAVIAVAPALAASPRPPAATGPLTQASDDWTGCTTATGCAFDYVLDPSATSDPGDSWHAYWRITPAGPQQPRSSCILDAIDTLFFGRQGSAGKLPTRTYPPLGTSAVGPATPASLIVDAGGHATTAGRLAGPGMPPGLATVTAHRGYITVLWQGRATRDPSLVLGVELANPDGTAPSLDEGANEQVPCSAVAPPGTTYLARIVPARVRQGQTAWLQLRIPGTGEVELATAHGLTSTEVDGTASVQVEGGYGGLVGKSKPEALSFDDRYSLPLREGFGAWTVRVTLRGPHGSRRYTLHYVVTA